MNTLKNISRVARAAAVLAVMSATLAGCSKFLEPKSQSEFSAKNIEQLNELIPMALSEPNNTTNYRLTGGFLDILSDDVRTMPFIPPMDPVGDRWYTESEVSAIYGLYTWQPNWSVTESDRGNRQHGRMYEDIYNKLVYANSILDYVDRVSGSAEMKSYVTAQAKALRGFYYLHLVNMFGVPYNADPDGPGIPVRTTGARENRPMERNTVREVYARIEEDLLAAVELFESVPTTYQFREYRPSLPMSLLLLARTYLYMENWEKAEFYADRLITEWPRFRMLSLNNLIKDGITNVDPEAATTSSPAIRRKQTFYSKFLTYENSDVIWLYGRVDDPVALTAEIFSRSGESNPRIFNNKVLAGLALASDDLIRTYDPDDLRLRTYLVRSVFNEPNYDNNSFDPSKVVYKAYAKTVMPNVADAILPETDRPEFGYSLRITEAYLILAEALAMQTGREGEALQVLSKIWDNRFAEGAAGAPESYKNGDVIELVRDERRRELCFESLRWFDLRRWGMKRIEHVWYETVFGDRQVFILEEGDPGFTLPMPEYLLQKNPDLGQVPVAYGGNGRPAEA